ncbi:M20/M25/M40 family metallo-hydrolase [Bacillus sp. SCS-151]|uniref:M20/M25/M40 family metallo-hydrolase n=1 Tax=Nanhaiella sioensis TaxID=3115293 RepID=UPI003978D7B7
MSKKWQSKQQFIDLLCQLVSIPSVTGSQAETWLPQFVISELESLPYFQNHKDHITLHATDDGRYFASALVKRSDKCKKTVILLSHFDVVDVADYGNLHHLAFDAKKLTAYFYKHKFEMAKEVSDDLETGDWLFGRGTMDMKCGLAMHMAMIELACNGDFDGNILLLTVPDEEVNSVGMRAAIPTLLELADTHKLTYTAVLNSEPMFSRFPGDQTKYLYTGTIGKVLPGFFCYGKETHVGEPFSGLNANYMASIINDELELNTILCEKINNEVTPPPTALIQHDLQKEYSVQVTNKAVTLFNVFMFKKPMNKLTDELKKITNTAALRIQQSFVDKASSFAALTNSETPSLHVKVYTYEELVTYAKERYGSKRIEALHQEIFEQHKQNLDDRELSITIVDQLSSLCKHLSPMIVLFFAPPFYPAVYSHEHPMIQQVMSDLNIHANRMHNILFQQVLFFNGISDLSYVGLQHSPSSIQPLIANFPLWDHGYSLPIEDLKQLDIPVLNVGPIGRDAHKWTERLDVNYTCDTLLELFPYCIQRLFGYSKSDQGC